MFPRIILVTLSAVILSFATACEVTPLPITASTSTMKSSVSPMPDATLISPATVRPLPNPTRAASSTETAYTPSATRTRVTPTPVTLDPSKLGTIDRDITYCTVGAVALKLDLYYPKQTDGKLFPVAINIHGGSWSFGDKKSSDSAFDIPELVQRGYVVAAVDYRLAPTYKFPAQIEDVKCAVRFLRAHATTYHLDSNRIGAWGCSAGGHLAALLGVTDSSNGFDQGEYTDQSSQVKAVVALTAPMDINLYDVVARADMLKHVFGTAAPHDSIFALASPVTYVSKNTSPFLILQGDKDNLIVPQHGDEMQTKLIAAGVFADLVTVKEGHHCLPPQPAMSPSREEISKMVADFFDQKLK